MWVLCTCARGEPSNPALQRPGGVDAAVRSEAFFTPPPVSATTLGT